MCLNDNSEVLSKGCTILNLALHYPGNWDFLDIIGITAGLKGPKVLCRDTGVASDFRKFAFLEWYDPSMTAGTER